MDVIERLYTEWAWRTKSGVPNIKNPEDKKILDDLIYELDLSQEKIIYESSDSYDTEIQKRLVEKGRIEEGASIPPSTGNYKFSGAGQGNFVEDVAEADMQIWRDLWTVKPQTKKGEADNLGVGKGEVSLYWLYNYNKNNPVKVGEGRVGDAPDLDFGGVGVEVKAYDSGTAGISLGRFSQDKENLQLLSVAFGLNTLTNVLDPQTEAKVLNPTNFNGTELPGVFESVAKFSSLENLDSLAQQYGIFKTIKDNTDFLIGKLGASNSVEAAKQMTMLILTSKLKRKPGDGNYLTNVSSKGKLHWWNVDLKKIRQSDNLLKSFGISQSKIRLNFNKVLS